MFGVATSDDYQPVAWMGRYPIHVTTLLVITHVICMVNFGGVPMAHVRRTLELMSSEIFPRFQPTS